MSLHNLEAERAILASVLLDPVALPQVSHLLAARDFYHLANELVFASMVRVAATGAPIDTVTLRADMVTAGTWERAGGDAFVLSLMDTVPATENVEAHAKLVRDASRRRALIAVCRTVAAQGGDVAIETGAFLDGAESALYQALSSVARADAYMPMLDAVQKTREENATVAAERGRTFGVTTGIESLDYHLKGLRKGELIVIGGKTSEGKSALATTICRNNAKRGKRSAVFSLEMPHVDMVQRLVAMEGVSVSQQESYSFVTTKITGKRLRDAYNDVERLPIEIVYKPRITIPQIRTYCRRLMVDKPLDLVVVDYLALLGSTEKSENRNREIASFTGALLELAGDLAVPLIAIQSLKRTYDESGNSKRPQLSHLMDSSSIEYDAHKVLLVHNPNAKNEDRKGDDTGEREVIIAKNRRGRRDVVCPVKMHLERFTFTDLEAHREAPDDRDIF